MPDVGIGEQLGPDNLRFDSTVFLYSSFNGDDSASINITEVFVNRHGVAPVRRQPLGEWDGSKWRYDGGRHRYIWERRSDLLGYPLVAVYNLWAPLSYEIEEQVGGKTKKVRAIVFQNFLCIG